METAQREKLEKLWKKFQSSRDEAVREALIMSYTRLVKYVAGRIEIGLPSYVDVDDLYSAGILGLMQAIDKFDPERNIKFETYAVPRIRGAMLDELRAQDWFPRSLRKKAKILERAFAEVESKLGRTATDNEIAGYLKIPLADYYDLMDEVCLTTLISLDIEIANCSEGLHAVIGRENQPADDSRDPLQMVEDKELAELIRRVLEDLPEKERLVLHFYYFDDMTLKEIGEVLNISESRVCQIHTKATLRLRGRIMQYTKAYSLRHLAARLQREKKTHRLKKEPA